MRTIAVLLAFFAAATPSRAQSASTPVRAEVSGGYAFSGDLGCCRILPLGWFVGAAWPATEWLAVSGELASHQGHEKFEGGRSDVRMWSALLGARVSRRIGPSLTAFVRGSSGLTTVTNHTYETSPALSDPFAFDVALTITAPAVQFGAGADVDLNSRVSVRTLVEYRRIIGRRLGTLELPAWNSLEITSGLAMRFGSR